LPSEKDENGLGSRVKAEIEAFVASVAQTEEWLRENPPKIEWLIDADCGETSVNDPFVRENIKNSEKHLLPAIIEGVSAHTDLGWFEKIGIPTIVIGAGNPRVAHQNDECVLEEELIKLTKYIATLITQWVQISD
jgi:acetylornithine deacetylase